MPVSGSPRKEALMCTSVVVPPCPRPAALPTISPEELHRYLLKAHRLENRVKYRFIEGLRAMDAGRLYLKLGYSSTRQYAEKHFGWERSRVYEALRVAGCLEKLPLTKEAFVEGFPYSRVEEITRVATAETEAEWIAFARKTSMRKLRAEVQDAREKNRKHPRSGSFGLPAVRMRLPFDFSPEEYDLLEKALRKISKELLAKLLDPSKELGPREALIFLAKRILETDPATLLEGRVDREDSIYTILYHRCPDCRSSHLATEDGPVEVPPEVVERVEAGAHRVEIRPEDEVTATASAGEPDIDRPNPRSLLRRLFLRDGRVCANSGCGRTDNLQGHHLQARSRGGRTALSNEISLCPICHSMVELGYVEPVGSPLTGLEFRTRGDKIAADLRAESEEAAEIPVVVVAGVSGYPDSGLAAGEVGSGARSRASGYPDNREDAKKVVVEPRLEEADAFADAVQALRKLEFPKTEALSRARKALERLRGRGEKPTAEALVKEAFRVRA